MGEPGPIPPTARFDDLRIPQADGRVMQIRGLLDAGLPTRIIKQILPCLDTPRVLICPQDATPELIATLEHERDRMTSRVEFLTRHRDAIASYLDAVRGNRHPVRPADEA